MRYRRCRDKTMMSVNALGSNGYTIIRLSANPTLNEKFVSSAPHLAWLLNAWKLQIIISYNLAQLAF